MVVLIPLLTQLLCLAGMCCLFLAVLCCVCGIQAGLHRILQGGIDFGKDNGPAYSIVISGGYAA